MPAEHGVRLEDQERVAPFGKPSTDENPEPAVAVTEPWAWRPALQHDQLLTQAQILDDQVRSGFCPRRDRSPRPPDHAKPLPSVLDLPGSFTGPARRKGRWIEFLRPTGPTSDSPAPCVGSGRAARRRVSGGRRVGPGLPAPVEPEALAVPGQPRGRLHDDETGPPVRPQA
jgi:hypothetical protein